MIKQIQRNGWNIFQQILRCFSYHFNWTSIGQVKNVTVFHREGSNIHILKKFNKNDSFDLKPFPKKKDKTDRN